MVEPTDDTFGARLRATRKALGLSAAEAAQRARTKLGTYYSWEAAKRIPRDVVAVAKAFDTTVGALYGERAA